MSEITRLNSALTAIDAACAEVQQTNGDRHQATARGLLRGYDARWGEHHGWETESVEQEFCQPIYNLSAQGKRITTSRTFRVAGKKDVLALDHQEQRWVWDHKTTSDDIEKPDSTFWQQLSIEGQASLYLLSEHLAGHKAAGAMWDAIRKPGIRPKKLSKADQKTVTSGMSYFGHQASEQTRQQVVNEPVENGELYENRLAWDCCERPNHYFQRREVLRLDGELLEYVAELWELAAEIRECRQRNRHLRNSGACLQYGSPCVYLGICSGYDNPDSAKWQWRENVHSELDTLDGRDVLTNSRLRCFQTCRRKHYYRYELGIERVDARTSDALYLGTIVHAALAAWWSHSEPGKKIHGP